MRRNSEITVKEVLDHSINPILVYYNGIDIYDDTDTNPNYIALNLPEDFEGYVPDYDLWDLTEQYANKKVYSYKVRIVSFHHSVISIVGE